MLRCPSLSHTHTYTPPHPTPLKLPGAFKFKDYAPAVFHSLRERFAVDQVRHSLTEIRTHGPNLLLEGRQPLLPPSNLPSSPLT